MHLRLGSLMVLTATFGAAQPQISYRGVVNAASFMAPGLPGGAIARGSIFTIFGRRLGPASSPALAFPLQTTLGGVSIAITQGSTVVNAIPLFVSAGQVNAILPSNAPLGVVSLRLSFNNAASNPVPAQVVNSAFGVFTATGSGMGPAIAQNFITQAQQPINALTAPVRPGQVVTLWGTGLGPATFPDNVAPTPGNLPVLTEVFVGAKSASILYNGRSPCCSGTDQVVFTVPADAPLGCWVPVYVRLAGTLVSNAVTMAISNGPTCSEPSNALASTLISGGRTASFVAARFSVRHDVGVARTSDSTADEIAGYPVGQVAGPFNFNPMLSLPPPGTCTTYSVTGWFPNEVSSLPGSAPTGATLDPGTITLSGSAGTSTLVSLTSLGGLLVKSLGGSVSTMSLLPDTSFLNPGAYTLAGAGGRDVGSFRQQVTVPQPLTWTNRDSLSLVNRRQNLMLSWTGANPGSLVVAAGGGADLPNNATGFFLCVAISGDNSLTVPAYAMANVPPSHQRLIQSPAAVYLGQWSINQPQSFMASGIDAGLFTSAQVIGKTVVFQ